MIATLVISMLFLSLEKMTYMYVYNHPKKFQHFCQSNFSNKYSDVQCLGFLLMVFKIIQISVFMNWWYLTTNWQQFSTTALIIGGSLFTFGQILNFGVFRTLGNTGVLYGKQFGYDIPWVSSFPFTITKHPQYVGTMMSIWGCFIAINYSYEYWYAIPALETILYILGSEQEHDFKNPTAH